MRTPSEYLPAAVKKLRSRLMPDCSELLRHAGRCATVTRVGSPSRGEDALTETEIVESAHVLALAADFPELTKGSAVELGGTLRIVTSCRTDPAKAHLVVGLSDELEAMSAAYRRPGKPIRTPLNVLAIESQTVAYADEDAAAPSIVQTWLVCISDDQWPETTPPQTGDEIALADRRETFLRVASVVHGRGYWILRARPRGGAKW